MKKPRKTGSPPSPKPLVEVFAPAGVTHGPRASADVPSPAAKATVIYNHKTVSVTPEADKRLNELLKLFLRKGHDEIRNTLSDEARRVFDAEVNIGTKFTKGSAFRIAVEIAIYHMGGE